MKRPKGITTEIVLVTMHRGAILAIEPVGTFDMKTSGRATATLLSDSMMVHASNVLSSFPKLPVTVKKCQS